MEQDNWKDKRNQILGLGDHSSKKSYYPELQKKISDLEKHKELLDQLSSIVFFASADTGEIFYTNHAAKQLLKNYSVEKDIHDIFPGIQDLFDELSSGEEKTFSEIIYRHEVATPYEIRIRKKEYDDRPILFIIGQDISDKLSFENEILRSKNNFETIFNSTYDAIFIHDTRGNIIDVNDSILDIYDLPNKEKALEYTITEYSSDQSNLVTLEQTWEKVLNGQQQLIQWTAQSPMTGRTFDAEVSLQKGEFFRQQVVVAVVRDISERKEIENKLRENERKLKSQNSEYLALNEELQERNNHIQNINRQLEKAKEMAEESDRLKSAFLANVSHEIRTPLNAIIGFSQLMAEHQYDQDALKRYSQIIQQRGNDLIRIISDILDISKIEADKIEIFNEIIVIEEFFQELKEGYIGNPVLQTKLETIDLSFHISEDLIDKKFVADPSRLKQVLINLIDNALKFTEEGFIKIELKEAKHKKLTFIVEDTGCGIAKKMQNNIFKEFRQAFNKSEKQYTGTGLGLTISKALVDLMNGEILVESELDKGSKFYFHLPFIRAE